MYVHVDRFQKKSKRSNIFLKWKFALGNSRFACSSCELCWVVTLTSALNKEKLDDANFIVLQVISQLVICFATEFQKIKGKTQLLFGSFEIYEVVMKSDCRIEFVVFEHGATLNCHLNGISTFSTWFIIFLVKRKMLIARHIIVWQKKFLSKGKNWIMMRRKQFQRKEFVCILSQYAK